MKRTDAVVGVVLALPRIGYKAWRHAIVPLPLDVLNALRKEGLHPGLGVETAGRSFERFLKGAGPVFQKVGQILSTRDMFPKEVSDRLETLFTEPPAMSPRAVSEFLRERFGENSPFESFETECLAVGSIGQVHRARLRDGSPVIVKFLRPGVVAAIERDLREIEAILEVLTLVWIKINPDKKFLLRKAFADLSEGLRREANFMTELESLETFREQVKSNPRLCVPKPYREYSDRDVIVMEELKGESLSSLTDRAKDDPEAAKRVADLAIKEILHQIFDGGFFHADPHGENLLLLEDGRLGLIDLGLTGKLSGKYRKAIGRAVKALLARDSSDVVDALLEFAKTPPDFDIASFRSDVVTIFDKHKSSVIAKVRGKSDPDGGLDEFFGEFLTAVHRHRIRLPREASLLIKSVLTIEGVARGLDPELNLMSKALPVMAKSMAPEWIKRLMGR